MIFVPLFHRDKQTLPEANAFSPELWSGTCAAGAWTLMPFSQGPAESPGRNLVLLITSELLARLLAADTFAQLSPVGVTPGQALPATLSPFMLRFRLNPRSS